MYDVITIGTATRDVFLTSPLFKVVRDPGHLKKLGFPTGEAQCFAFGGKIEVEAPVATMGGGATNSAVTFARQGFRTATIAKVADDLPGEIILRTLTSENITPFVAYDKKQGTGYSTILLAEDGERTILSYRGASSDIRKSDIPFGKSRARWVYIVPGTIPLSTILSLARHFRKTGARIAMNPSKRYIQMGVRKLKPILDGLDVILVNREEASYLTGKPYNDERGIFKTFDELVKGIAVMTDGPKGVLVSDGRTLYRAGIYKEKKVVDRTGAGDAFGSGFVAGLMRKTAPTPHRGRGPDRSVGIASRQWTVGKFPKEAVEYAIRLGSANATSVVERIGAQEGILRRREFQGASRFRKLTIEAQKLS